tara:strand:- start:6491 stop:6799 length:309 start_codon:yes stop_codon:yes gene_type:complete
MDLENKHTEIEHLRKLLQTEMKAKKDAIEELEKYKNAYLTIDKKDYPKDVVYYKKAKLFEIRKGDNLQDDDIWESYCQDLEVDKEEESFCICVMGIKFQHGY